MSKKNSLQNAYPEVTRIWDFKKNNKTPSDYSVNSHDRVFWKCPIADDHEWDAIISHVSKSFAKKTKTMGCPICQGSKVVKSNCLATIDPEMARTWHPIKNGSLTPLHVTRSSSKKVWWKCVKGYDHEWNTSVGNRVKQECPFCQGKKVSKTSNLAYEFPQLAKEWNLQKNGDKKPEQFRPGSNKYVWWICQKGHEYEARISHRVLSESDCPFCFGKKLSGDRSLASKRPDLAKEFHPAKNGASTPDKIHASARTKVWWLCSKDSSHEWESTVDNRNKGNDCPYCTNRGGKVGKGQALGDLHKHLLDEWDFEDNKKNPYEYAPLSNEKVHWICIKDKNHKWIATICHRVGGTGCPYCNSGWTVENIRLFVASLLPLLHKLTEAELYVLFQQSGTLDISSNAKGNAFIQAFKTGKFPLGELEKFVNHQPSLVDEFLNTPNTTLQEKLKIDENDFSEEPVQPINNSLPIIETKDVLSLLNEKIFANLDKEAVEFFIHSAVAKIWQHAFVDENKAIQQLDEYTGNGLYPQKVKHLFYSGYQGAKKLIVPEGYCFPYHPNLMQLYTAFLIKSRKRIGNWSGTGAGKTLSAILASRIIGARLTIVCCPNNVMDNWQEDIEETYRDSHILINNLSLNPLHQKTYIIMNYDFFQQSKASGLLTNFLERNIVDFIIIDEIHYAKQREESISSKRRKIIAAFLSSAETKNANLHVLGMSATPVLNNLFEGKTLIELVTGIRHDDLKTQGTQSNCISLYQKFILYGIRWVPDYGYRPPIKQYISAREFIPEIIQNALSGSMVQLEAILTKAKLPLILKNLIPKTIVYTYYLQGIEQVLFDAIQQQGWKVGLFTGEDKEGLSKFIDGKIDILIASSCIETGIDGLQTCTDRLIINCLPWTHGAYKQLVGRFYRQGQINNNFEVIILMAYIENNGDRKSRCESRWNYIERKRSLADAAVDGVITEENVRSHQQIYQDFNAWVARLDRGEVFEVERQKISSPLFTDSSSSGIRKLGDLTKLNQQINKETSQGTHQRLLDNPQGFYDYHATYRETRKDWEVVPYQEAIKWCRVRPHLIIGDFGCGEAFLAQELPNQVYSFDHVAINDKVIACDMSNVNLPDNSLDATIFSLSLMGTNWIDYLREAKRCLKLDGHLWIAEPVSRIPDSNIFQSMLEYLGFDVRYSKIKGKFVFIEALKSDREINEIILEDDIHKNILG